MRASIALLASSILFISASAAAQDFEQVQLHFDNGVRLYEEGKYDAAIDEFQKGYALYPDPVLLYNISMAHGKMGRMDQSLAVAQLAHSTGLEDPDRTQNLARISALQASQNSRDIASNAAVARANSPSGADTWLGRTDWRFWAGAGAVGLGVGSLVIGAVVDSGISDTIEAYEAAADAGETATYIRLRNTINDDQGTAIGLYVVGGLLVAGGGALMTWSAMENQTFAVVPTRGGAVAAWSLGF